jgi:glutamine amidotransferase
MKVAVIDYGSGNLRSAAKALERAAREAELTAEILVTAELAAIEAADRIVLPGVGAFGDCRQGLLAIEGLWETLEEVALAKARPFLGICVGMQLMATRGLEHGEHQGFGWIPGDVVRLTPSDPNLKIPHMGWNSLTSQKDDHPLLAQLGSRPYVYFVHSYHLQAEDPGQVLATTDYGGPIAALVGRDNLAGSQFHPEKSQAAGLRLLRNFLRWTP